jgi:hypothetical protein
MSGIEFSPLFYALPLAVAMFSAKDRHHVQTTLLGLELGPSRALQQQEQEDHTTRRAIFQQWTEVDQQQGQERPMRVNHDDEAYLEPSMEVTIDDEPSLEPSMEVTIDGMPVEIAEENAACQKSLYIARQMEKRSESRVRRSKTADPTKRQVAARQA